MSVVTCTCCTTFTSSLRRVTHVRGFLLHLKSQSAPFSAGCWAARKPSYFPCCFGRCSPRERKPRNENRHTKTGESESKGVKGEQEMSRKRTMGCCFAPCPKLDTEVKKSLSSLLCDAENVHLHFTKPLYAEEGCLKGWKCQENMIPAAPGGNKDILQFAPAAVSRVKPNKPVQGVGDVGV